MTDKKKDDDVEAMAVGCVALLMFGLGVLWFGFIGWCLYMLVTWLVNK